MSGFNANGVSYGSLVYSVSSDDSAEDLKDDLPGAIGRSVRLTVKRNFIRTRAHLALMYDEDSTEFAEELETATSKYQNYVIYGKLENLTFFGDITSWVLSGMDKPQSTAAFDDWTLEIFND